MELSIALKLALFVVALGGIAFNSRAGNWSAVCWAAVSAVGAMNHILLLLLK